MDAETSAKVGKLLVEESQESVNASASTYKRIYEMMGGAKTVVCMAVIQLMLKYWGMYSSEKQIQFADTDPQTQSDEYSRFMKQVFAIAALNIFFHQVKEYWLFSQKRSISHGIVSKTMKSIFAAPVNLFFDVTPIGKILQIFNEDMNRRNS